MNKYEIIKRPIVSEKSTTLSSSRKYTFEVDRNANKIQIKDAVETIFNVKVAKVNIINGYHKEKTVGQYKGYKKAVSKAIVTLEEGNSIDIYKA